MSELDNAGADASVDENALFNAVTRGTDLPQAEAPKPAETPAAPAPTPEPEDRVPSARLREEAEHRRRAERQAAEWQTRYEELTRKAQPQEPQHKPDIFENASEFVRTEVSPEIQALRQTLYLQDRRLAIAEHGKDKVERAQALFDEMLRDQRIDPDAANKVMSSPQPFSEAIKWFNKHERDQKVGDDPDAWLEQEIEKRLNDAAFLAKAVERARATAPKVGGPAASAPSLPSLTRVGSAAVEQGEEPLSDMEMFNKATARKRR